MMEERNNLTRIFSALELPMNDDESINFNSLASLIEYELSIGVEGFYCLGSSGEALLLSVDERKKCLEEICKMVAGRVPIVAHVGSIRTKDAIGLAQHAASIGVDAISMIPPYYYRFSMDEIITYYEDIINAVPDIGVIVYNIPQFTGIEFNKENASRLLSNEHVIGVKHTSNNLYSLERMKSSYPHLLFFNGFDEQFLGALSMGAEATIGTTVNVFAPLFIRLRELFNSGNIADAYYIQTEINYCVEEMCKVGIFSAVKYILSMRGIDSGKCRKPFRELLDNDKNKMNRLIKQYDEFLSHVK